MAFVRCLTPDVVERACPRHSVRAAGWQVWRVADADDPKARTITADHAVELRESKGEPCCCSWIRHGPAPAWTASTARRRKSTKPACSIEALRLAGSEVTRDLSRERREYAEQAIKKSARIRPPFQRFALDRVRFPGPRRRGAARSRRTLCICSVCGLRKRMCSRLGARPRSLPVSSWIACWERRVAGLTPAQRIEALKLLDPSEDQRHGSGALPAVGSDQAAPSRLQELADKEHLWVNALRTEGAAQVIQSIELLPWRTNTGKIAKWSGLIEDEDADEPPVLILKPDAEKPATTPNSKFAGRLDRTTWRRAPSTTAWRL